MLQSKLCTPKSLLLCIKCSTAQLYCTTTRSASRTGLERRTHKYEHRTNASKQMISDENRITSQSPDMVGFPSINRHTHHLLGKTIFLLLFPIPRDISQHQKLENEREVRGRERERVPNPLIKPPKGNHPSSYTHHPHNNIRTFPSKHTHTHPRFHPDINFSRPLFFLKSSSSPHA